MNLLEAILLGIIQGATEFLPISSSGHLVIGAYLLDIQRNSDILFEVIVHLGTLCAIIYYYRLDIQNLCQGVVSNDKGSIKYLKLIIIATIPAVLIGLYFNDYIKALYNIHIVSYSLILTGSLILLSYFSKEKLNKFNFGYALLIGIAQAIAIVPGISRSGITISIALLLGVNRNQASKFSFFMAIPIIIGAVILEFVNINNIEQINYLNLFGGFIASGIIGYFSITWLINIINKLYFWRFSIYCWLLAFSIIFMI